MLISSSCVEHIAFLGFIFQWMIRVEGGIVVEWPNAGESIVLSSRVFGVKRLIEASNKERVGLWIKPQSVVATPNDVTFLQWQRHQVRLVEKQPNCLLDDLLRFRRITCSSSKRQDLVSPH